MHFRIFLGCERPVRGAIVDPGRFYEVVFSEKGGFLGPSEAASGKTASIRRFAHDGCEVVDPSISAPEKTIAP
jgi:hypothetical protein